ncbi:MAG: dTDP-glucose 4,6-dehydratase [Prevotella sp.]|nr:dTDP-glucose 4,6-dehydratase [Bacteroides sp.]MCM1366437.1 dTDP-glucose 4,6-dehydratase [Prevotella sp.]
MKQFKRNIMVTGGAGFIGSHLVRLLVNKYPDYRIINVDILTYAGNLENLKDIEEADNYVFSKTDILDYEGIDSILREYKVDGIIHLAAESHVDRSIEDPLTFAKTNVLGTLALLQSARKYWESLHEGYNGKLFYHVSTDEVYGALEITSPEGGSPYGDSYFVETTPYNPHSPYSASKASSDHFVRAYHDTYSMPVVISNCSNNYGPNQYPEKLIPLFISNICEEKPLRVYGKGENVRDWLYVKDHVKAIDLIFHKGSAGQTYNIGGFNEWKNIDLVKLLIKVVDEYLGNPVGKSEHLINYVTDRKGHDLRYAIDSTKLHQELGWSPELQFEEGIKETVEWYLNNPEWIKNAVR